MIGPKQREENFYEKNKGRAVNLLTEKGVTTSGNIGGYDKDTGMVTLINSIERVYERDGSSRFVEHPTEIEMHTSLFFKKFVTTRKDRLGRIVKYNVDLLIEEEERKRKYLNFR